MKPIVSASISALGQGSSAVVDGSHDQFAVWNDPNASDPTHSMASKDHFDLILNEPAGLVAQVIIEHTVNLVVKAWDDAGMNTRTVTEEILECLFHPAWLNNQCEEIRKDEAKKGVGLSNMGPLIQPPSNER